MLVLALIGLAVGSFLNVLIYRLNTPGTAKLWQGRSICPQCKHELAWRDNIPLLSFLVLLGRCRYCHRPISWQYPVVELVTMLVTVFLWHSPIALFLAYSFIVIFFSDLLYGLIPDEMIIIGVALGVLGNLGGLGRAVAVGSLSAIGFFLVVLATRFKGMGLGDVKLAFLIGFLLGWPKALVAFWSAFVLGGGVAFVLLLLKKKTLSATIALGPFLVVGTLISALWSDVLLRLVLP